MITYALSISGSMKRSDKKDQPMDLLRIIAGNLPDTGIIIFDRDLRIIISEGDELRKLSLTTDDLAGKTIYQIHDTSLRLEWEPLFRKAFENKKIVSEYRYRSEEYRITIIPAIIDNDETAKGIAVIENISEAGKKIRSLRRSAQEAEKAKLLTREYLARISHDIRTPLSAIVGFTEQLARTRLDKRQKEYIRILEESSDHLMMLINDLLALSRIEAGEMHIEQIPFRIPDIVKSVCETFSLRAEEKNLGFSVHMDESLDQVLTGDPLRLRQILINLLGNGLNFTEKGSVRLGCYTESENYENLTVRFEVADTGIGISKANQKKIFRRFTQAERSTARLYGGTGLGLTICKSLVEIQNGRIWVSSRIGKGSTFFFTLTYKKEKETDILSPGERSINRMSLKNKKLLLVDDDNFNLLLGKTILGKFKCKFDIAGSGRQAIEFLGRSKYDLVLLDMHMHGIDGIEVSRFIRNDHRNKSSKILALTAGVLKKEIIDYYAAGIDDFLIKPYKEIQLFNKICKLLQVGESEYMPSRAEVVLREEIVREPYDLSELIRISGGDRKLIAKMLDIFIANSENAVVNINRLLEKKRWNDIGEEAHKMIPSCQHLGCRNIVTTLLKLKELTMEDHEYKSVPSLVARVTTDLNQMISLLKKERDLQPPASPDRQ